MIAVDRDELHAMIDLSDLTGDSKILLKKSLYMLEKNINEYEVMKILRWSANEEITTREAIDELDKLYEEYLPRAGIESRAGIF